MKRGGKMDKLLIKCEECEYRWIGDDFDEDCPSCESENIKVIG